MYGVEVTLVSDVNVCGTVCMPQRTGNCIGAAGNVGLLQSKHHLVKCSLVLSHL